MTLRNLCRRVIAEWKIKLILGGAITVGFWWGYFFLERLPSSAVTQMPELAIDRLIPFRPDAAFFYLSQFLLTPMVIWLLTSRSQLWSCCRGLALVIGTSFLLFYACPTSIARPVVFPGHFYFYDCIARIDLPRNAFPSLHAGFGVFIACWAREASRGGAGSRWFVIGVWLWTVAVLVSTLLIKQHVILDLAGGSLLGVMGYRFGRHFERGRIARETAAALFAPQRQNDVDVAFPKARGRLDQDRQVPNDAP